MTDDSYELLLFKISSLCSSFTVKLTSLRTKKNIKSEGVLLQMPSVHTHTHTGDAAWRRGRAAGEPRKEASHVSPE